MGSARFTDGGIGKVHRWWVWQGSPLVGSLRFIGGGFDKVVGQFLGRMWCVVWVSSRSEGPRFPFLLTFSSHPLYLGIEFEKDLKPILVYFICF